jgi:hypothetical protein
VARSPVPASRGRRAARSALLTVVCLAMGASAVQGQLKLWVGGAYTEALDGQWGADGRLAYNLIALPVEVFAGADYFLPDCEDDCSLWGWRLGGNLRLPVPGLTPYGSAAWVNRELGIGEGLERRDGVAIGVGLSLEVGLKIQGEISREFLGGELDKTVFRLALGF